jgi:hypothetical protein
VTGNAYRALLIANSTYPNDAHNLPDLEGPRNDPALLRDALCDDRYGLFPNHHVRLVVERTMAEVLREAEEFLRSANRQDTLLIYYTGHGKLDLSGELYLCARDSRADRLRSTAVKASDLSAMIEESAAATTVVLLDCCHSGAFKGAEMAQALAGRGRFVVTSCRTGELANDAHALNHASMFTHHVVEGMLGRAPDHDGDGLVGLDDLYGYVHARLAAENRQIPQRSFAGTGDVPMARRAEAAVPNAVAPESPGDAALAHPILDVSETVIALDGVGIDEELPPERVAVVNRGGGQLSWSAECTAGWVTLVAEEHGLVLHLRPGPGTNRANVHVRDDRTGMVKTVRLVVRTTESVASPSPPAPAGPQTTVRALEPQTVPASEDVPEPQALRASEDVPEPDEHETAPAPELAEAGAEPPREVVRERRPVPAWFGAAMAGAALAGTWLALSGIGFVEDFAEEGGTAVFLRDWDYGPGLGTSILGGLALAGIAGVGLVAWALRRRYPKRPWRFLVGLALGLAAPLTVERISMSFRWDAESWFFDDRSEDFATIPTLLGLVAVGLCAFVLRTDGAIIERAKRAPARLVAAGALFAVLWGAGSAVSLYGSDAYTRSYVDVIDTGRVPVTVTVVLLVAVLASAVVVAGTWLSGAAGRGVLAGAAVFVVAIEAIEVLTLFGPHDSRQGLGFLWMFVPAAAYVRTIVLLLRRSPTR